MSAKEYSLSEAMEVLTVGEVQGMERHYGRTLDSGNLSGTDLTAGVVWALERRTGSGKDKFDWKDVESFTMKALNDYFLPEAVEVDEDSPESDEGKGESLAA
jgi:hypothetical protein